MENDDTIMLAFLVVQKGTFYVTINFTMSIETNPALCLSYKAAGDEDAALVAQCREGNTDAFEQLVSRHQKRMLNIAWRVIGDYEEACEAVQDAFVAAYRSIRNFRGDAKFSTWMTTITLNYAKNRLKQVRSRKSIIPVSLDEPVGTDEGTVARETASREASQLDRIETKDVQAKVRQCMDALDAEYREVIILRDLQELSYEEIGSVLKLREGTVKSRLFRARESVKECLKKAWGEIR